MKMKEISIENIKWQRRLDPIPIEAWLPIPDAEAERIGLPQLEIIQCPERVVGPEKEADFAIRFLERRYGYKVYSITI